MTRKVMATQTKVAAVTRDLDKLFN